MKGMLMFLSILLITYLSLLHVWRFKPDLFHLIHRDEGLEELGSFRLILRHVGETLRIELAHSLLPMPRQRCEQRLVLKVFR